METVNKTVACLLFFKESYSKCFKVDSLTVSVFAIVKVLFDMKAIGARSIPRAFREYLNSLSIVQPRIWFELGT